MRSAYPAENEQVLPVDSKDQSGQLDSTIEYIGYFIERI